MLIHHSMVPSGTSSPAIQMPEIRSATPCDSMLHSVAVTAWPRSIHPRDILKTYKKSTFVDANSSQSDVYTISTSLCTPEVILTFDNCCANKLQ